MKMTRGRKTKASATCKRPSPMLPDGDEGKNLDVESRKDKVRTLIEDFKSEISSRRQNLETKVDEMLKQIDLAFAMEMVKIPQEQHKMKLFTYLKTGVMAPPDRGTSVHAIIGIAETLLDVNDRDTKCTLSTIDEQEGLPVEICRKAKNRKNTESLTSVPSTMKPGRKHKKGFVMNATPAGHNLTMSNWGTPMITPKFDPRLFQTPGGAAGLSMRVPKPGEIMMSMDGSPLMNTDQPKGIVVPINDHKSLLVTAEADVSQMDLRELDPTTIQGYIKSLQTLQEKLDTITKFPVKSIK